MDYLRKYLNPYRNLPKGIYLLFICLIITSIGNCVFPLITLILTVKVGYTKEQVGMVIAVFAILQTLCVIISGKLVDNFGRKKMLILFYILGALFYIICSIIETNYQITFFIIAASVLLSMTSPIINVLIADFTNTENRKASFSLMYLAYNLGFSISPILAGALFAEYLNLLFIIDATCILISVIIFAIYIKEPKMKDKHDNDQLKGECRRENTLCILLRHPVLIFSSIVMVVYQFAYSQWGFLLPLQMVEQFYDNGAKYYGIVAAVNGFTVIFFTPVVTHLFKKTNSGKVIAYGGFFYAIAFVLFGISAKITLFIISIFIMTLGEIAIIMNYNSLIANSTPETHRGRVVLVLSSITGSGYVLGPVVVGKFAYLGYTFIWKLLAIGVAIAAIIMCFTATFKCKEDKIYSINNS